jgi:hypothetical protein
LSYDEIFVRFTIVFRHNNYFCQMRFYYTVGTISVDANHLTELWFTGIKLEENVATSLSLRETCKNILSALKRSFIRTIAF